MPQRFEINAVEIRYIVIELSEKFIGNFCHGWAFEISWKVGIEFRRWFVTILTWKNPAC